MSELPRPASCELRALAGDRAQVRLVTRNLTFTADKRLGLDTKAEHPAALDLLVGALAADLMIGFSRAVARAGVPLHDAELRLEAHLQNPLVALGVVGETGSPALAHVRGKLFVSAEADAAALQALWDSACAHAPVFATLTQCASIDIVLQLVL